MRIHFMTLVRKAGDEAGLVENLRLHDPAVSIDVLAGAESICAGYNALVRRARARAIDAGIYGFVHDDARLWFDYSRAIPRYLDGGLPRPGLIGFIGAARMGLDSRWWLHPPFYGGVLTIAKAGPGPPDLVFCPVEPGGHRAVDALDGFCLFVRRDVYERIGGFDERFRSWHCYDADLCMAALAAGYQNYVIGELTQHVSRLESFSKPWVMENLKWLFKWRPFLEHRSTWTS